MVACLACIAVIAPLGVSPWYVWLTSSGPLWLLKLGAWMRWLVLVLVLVRSANIEGFRGDDGRFATSRLGKCPMELHIALHAPCSYVWSGYDLVLNYR